MELFKLKDIIFERGNAEGFSDMEVYYQSSSEFSCKVFKGEIDHYSIAKEGGISFRGIFGGQMGYAYTEKIDESAAEILIQIAKENAQIIESEDNETIFEGSIIYNKVDMFSDDLVKVTPELKLDLIKRLEKEAYDLDPRVINVNYCAYQDYENEKMLYNTKGLNKSEKSNVAVVYVSAVVQEDEDIKNAFAFKIDQNFNNFEPKALAKKAVDRAISYLGAKPVESKSYTILLENTAAADLIDTFSGIFSADNVQKGRSLLKNKLGEKVASPFITIVDDPFMEGGVVNRSFDSEGVSSQKTLIMKDGVLNSLLHNLKTAQKDGVKSTGNGYKSSYKGTITVAPSNFYIQPGKNTFPDLLKSMDEGLVITELEGLHSGANPISGDFSLAASGYYIKEGKIERPVNQITIAGNFYEVLKNIEAVGEDLAFTLPGSSYIGSPTLKIKNIAVAGE